MDQVSVIASRVSRSSTLPELLDAGVSAFEVIRVTARECEDRAPGLFAAFMMTAGNAVEGRNALLEAPSLPPGSRRSVPAEPTAASGDTARIADNLAALAGKLRRQLTDAALTAAADDHAACRKAAKAAAEIHRLLARDPR